MPLTYSTMSGRLVFSPAIVTSSAMAKVFLFWCSQSINQTVMFCSPISGLTFTPYRSSPYISLLAS